MNKAMGIPRLHSPLVFLGLLLSSPSLALDLVFPENVQVTIISEHMSINGLPLMAYEFMSPDDGESALKFYREFWSRNPDDADTDQPYMETKIGDWRVLSRLQDGHNITVQVGRQALAGSQVLVGISPLPKYLEKGYKPGIRNSLPSLGRASVVSVVRSTANDDEYESYWLESGDSVESTLNYYTEYYSQRRYEVSRKRVVDPSSRSTEAAMMMAIGSSQRIRMDAVRMEDKTRVIATITRESRR